MKKNIENAIKQKLLLKFNYNWKERIVEPRLFWLSTTSKLQLRSYQIGPWDMWSWYNRKLFDLDKIENLETTTQGFDETNQERLEDYNPNDKQFDEIYAKI